MSGIKDPNDLGLKVAYGYSEPSDLQRFYDDGANGYDKYLSDTGYSLHQHLAKEVFKDLKNPRSLILDIGCGTGIIAEHFGSIEPRLIFEGVDLSIKMIEIAGSKRRDPEAKDKPDQPFYRAMTQANLKDNAGIFAPCRYDILVSAGTFTTGHISIQELINMIYCLKHKGKVFVTVKKDLYHDHSFDERLQEIAKDEWITPHSAKEVNIYDNNIYNDQAYIVSFNRL